MGRLDNKIALISGGTGGQGTAELKLFCQEGAKVVFGDLDDEKGKVLESEVRKDGGEATYVHLDVTSESDWQKAVSKTIELYDGLDILVNNAGVLVVKSLEDTTEEDWDFVYAVNTKGPFLGIKSAISIMKKSGGGSIINTSSMAGLYGSPLLLYGSSKAAVANLSKSVAVQYGAYGIRCNSLHPGVLEGTLMGDDYLDDTEWYKKRLSQVPLNRMGVPTDLAMAALYLASDESSYVSGLELMVDGGMFVKR
jgi:cyclopentanol dehydrogenase